MSEFERKFPELNQADPSQVNKIFKLSTKGQ